MNLKKLGLALALGVAICCGHWVTRATLVYYKIHSEDEQLVSLHSNEQRRESAGTPIPMPDANPTGPQLGSSLGRSEPLSGERLPAFIASPWQFLSLAIPRDLWHLLFLVSLFFSVFFAFVLNSYFPDEYRDLGMKEIHTSLIQVIIPTLQVLAAVIASATIDHLHLHIVATAIYLLLFIAWDLAILLPGSRLGLHYRPDITPGEGGKKFQKQVRTYLWRIDLPAALPFALLAGIAVWRAEELGPRAAEHFVAGVMCAQACAAGIAVANVVGEDYQQPEPSQQVAADEEADATPAVS